MAHKVPVEITEEIVKNQDNSKYHDMDLYYGDDENSILSKDTLYKKYLAPEEDCPFDMWMRVCWGVAQAEKEEDRVKWARKYFSILSDYKFVPGGRINYGVGRDEIKVSFSNCYVLPIKEDSIEAIYKCVLEEAKTMKFGGGCGHDLSILRPKDSPIKGTGGNSCGSIGFMEIFSCSTNTVRQNNRRGASMQSLLVSHPDIEDFIVIKNDASSVKSSLMKIAKLLPKHRSSILDINKHIESRRKVQHSNISVKLTDEFMKAVDSDKTFDLRWEGKIYKTLRAKQLWDKIVKNAWESAEPGLIFWDRMVETNNLEYINPILSTNPCAEIPLGAYGNCLLGHMNVSKFVKLVGKNYQFDFDAFSEATTIAIRFLDNVVTLNDGRHPLPEQNEIAKNERRVGLGITGLGDLLVMLGLQYGSEESLEFIDKLMMNFRNLAYNSSCELAKEKGAFPWFNADGFFKSKFAQALPNSIKEKINQSGIRNGMLLTCAPVGTGSIIALATSGIEPIYRIFYIRKVKNDDAVSSTEYKVYHPLVKKLFLDKGMDIPEYVVDSSQIKPEDRVKVQALIQKYIDNSISSTVNLPKSATEQDVANVYMMAWKLGCKGITVYREGSREGVLLSEEEYISGGFDVEHENGENGHSQYALKRPVKLQGETFKIRTDTGAGPVNCYYTVNFFPETKIPYELFIVEPPTNKDMKDVLMLELITRVTSMMLRHRIPMEFIVEQFEGLKNQYMFSLPFSIAKVLRNYVENHKNGKDKCSACGSDNVRIENGCYLCNDCGEGKCS